MYIADADLKMSNGALVYAAGSEVPAEALTSEAGKAYGWRDLVSEARTKTMRAEGPGTEKPTAAAKEAAK